MRRRTFATRGKVDRTGAILGKLISLVLILAALGTVGGLGYARWKKKKPALPPVEKPVVNVKTEVVRTLPEVLDTIVLPAVVEANRVVEVAAEVTGRIEEVSAVEGTPCKAGMALIRLNADLLQAEYNRSRAQLRFDDKEFTRMQSLKDGGAVTQRQLEQAEAKKDASKANEDMAKARLDRARIVAPIDGILNKIHVERGEYVKSGMLVAQIVDIKIAKVVVQVPEHDVQYFQKART